MYGYFISYAVRYTSEILGGSQTDFKSRFVKWETAINNPITLQSIKNALEESELKRINAFSNYAEFCIVSIISFQEIQNPDFSNGNWEI